MGMILADTEITQKKHPAMTTAKTVGNTTCVHLILVYL